MGINETIQSVITQLQTIQITNGDGVSVTPYVRVWNNQTERRLAGQSYDYQTPAWFVQTTLSEGQPIGMKSTGYEIEFTIMLEHFYLNGESTMEQDLIIFDMRDKTHRVLNGFAATDCTPMFSSGDIHDHQHNNTYLMAMTYKAYYIDMTSTQADTTMGFQYVTLTNPQLQIAETIYIGAIPPSGGGTVTTLNGSVIFGNGITTSIWYNGTGAPANTLGNNGDYYLDTDTGDIYNKVGGVYVFLMTIMGSGSGGGTMTIKAETDADFKAENNTVHVLPANTLTATRRVDVSSITTEFEIINGEQSQRLLYVNGQVFSAGGDNPETEVMSSATTHYRKAENKIIIIN